MSDEDVVGKSGRVSIPIPKDGLGEVIISIRGGCEAYTAYTIDGEPVTKNRSVYIVEQSGSRTVVVSEIQH